MMLLTENVLTEYPASASKQLTSDAFMLPDQSWLTNRNFSPPAQD